MSSSATLATPEEKADSGEDAKDAQEGDKEVLVQWVVMRKDLWSPEGLAWPRGSVIAQACPVFASSAGRGGSAVLFVLSVQ